MSTSFLRYIKETGVLNLFSLLTLMFSLRALEGDFRLRVNDVLGSNEPRRNLRLFICGFFD